MFIILNFSISMFAIAPAHGENLCPKLGQTGPIRTGEVPTVDQRPRNLANIQTKNGASVVEAPVSPGVRLDRMPWFWLILRCYLLLRGCLSQRDYKAIRRVYRENQDMYLGITTPIPASVVIGAFVFFDWCHFQVVDLWFHLQCAKNTTICCLKATSRPPRYILHGGFVAAKDFAFTTMYLDKARTSLSLAWTSLGARRRSRTFWFSHCPRQVVADFRLIRIGVYWMAWCSAVCQIGASGKVAKIGFSSMGEAEICASDEMWRAHGLKCYRSMPGKIDKEQYSLPGLEILLCRSPVLHFYSIPFRFS